MSFLAWFAIVAFLLVAVAAVLGDEFGLVVSFVLIILMFAGCQALVNDGKDLQTKPVTITETLVKVFDCTESGGKVYMQQPSTVWTTQRGEWIVDADMQGYIKSGLKSGACKLLINP